MDKGIVERNMIKNCEIGDTVKYFNFLKSYDIDDIDDTLKYFSSPTDKYKFNKLCIIDYLPSKKMHNRIYIRSKVLLTEKEYNINKEEYFAAPVARPIMGETGKLIGRGKRMR